MFSGIVLNTTKPYQVDDWISIDGTEGRVTDIDWRATRLQTSQGSMAVIPNSLAAKAKIINFITPGGHVRPGGQPAGQPPCPPANRDRRAGAGDAGLPPLLAKPAPSVAFKSSASGGVEYEISGFVPAMGQKREVRNQLSIWRSGTCRRRA